MRINLIVLKTSKPKDLAAFYTKIGLTFDYHRHGTGPMHYAATLDNIVFEIYPLPNEREKADDTLRLGFSVAHLDTIVEDLQTAGVKILKKPTMTEWGYMAIIEDLDGRKVELKELS